MTANSQVKIPTPSANKISSGGSYSRPSVPLSMYRELVQELETARIRIEVLEAHKDKIVKENQELILYVQQLQNAIASTDRLASLNSPAVPFKPPVVEDRKKQIIEIVGDRDRYTPASSSKNDGAINGWVLAIALMLVVVTSCLGAFLIVSSRMSK